MDRNRLQKDKLVQAALVNGAIHKINQYCPYVYVHVYYMF